MRPCKKVSFLRLVLVVAILGTGLSGLAHASDWMDVRLGLPPLQFEQSGEIQRSYFQSLSHTSDIQTYAGAAGDDEPLDLEALSKKMDNPLGSLWLLFVQNDMIRISDDFPLKRKRWVNVTLLQPILPVPLGSDWLLVSRPTIPLLKAPIPDLDTSGQGRFPPVGPGAGGPEFNDVQNRVSTDHQFELGGHHLSHVDRSAGITQTWWGKFNLGRGVHVDFSDRDSRFRGLGKMVGRSYWTGRVGSARLEVGGDCAAMVVVCRGG